MTLTARISPNDLVAVELLFDTVLSTRRRRPASRLPPIVKSPVDVSILNFSVVPSVILKSTSVPPLNTKFPEPLVSKFNGTAHYYLQI